MTKFLNDGLGDYVSGLGTPRDKMSNAAYVDRFLSDWELMNAYRSAWLPRKIVDIPAEDSTNEGRDWQASADQIELIEAEETRLGLWQKLADVQSKARLFGGAAIYIGTGDNDPSQPLDINSVGKGGLKYITVLSRREIIAGELDRDALSPTYGKPMYYEVTGASVFARIHPSRLAIFIGNKTPDPWLVGGQNSGWGDSVLQAAYDAFKNSDATSQNIASLVFEANVDVFGVPGLMANLSDPEYARRLHERFALAATAKGINRALIRDAEEQYERKSISFATLPELMQAFLNQVAGASDIPVTRLLGQSPGGLNATGEHDMKNYFKKIRSLQKLSISPAIYNLDECLIRSALGSRPPEVFYEWSPLEQMNEKERAEIGKLNADTANVYVQAGIFTPQEIRIAAKNQIVESGFYPGFDQVVEETDAGFDFSSSDEQEAVSASNGTTSDYYSIYDKYNPSQPRNKDGEWSSGGGGGGASAPSKSASAGGAAITDSEAKALDTYKNKNFKKINNSLRKKSDMDSATSDTVKGLDSAIDKQKPLSKKTELYRGIISADIAKAARKDPGSMVGKVITDDGYMSTTTSLAVAKGFAGASFGAKSGSVVMRISAPKGTKAVEMDKFGDKKKYTNKEAEMLLARGSKIKINKISDWNGAVLIDAEIVK